MRRCTSTTTTNSVGVWNAIWKTCVALAAFHLCVTVTPVGSNGTTASLADLTSSTTTSALQLLPSPSTLGTNVNNDAGLSVNNSVLTTATQVIPVSPTAKVNSTTSSPAGQPSTTPKSNSSQRLIIGIATGFGFAVGFIVVICIVWRCCCRAMRGNDQTSNKVAPQFVLPHRQPLGGAGTARPPTPNPDEEAEEPRGAIEVE